MKHLIPYVGDSSFGEDDMGNSRVNFLHHRGNNAVEKALEFMEKWDRRNW